MQKIFSLPYTLFVILRMPQNTTRLANLAQIITPQHTCIYIYTVESKIVIDLLFSTMAGARKQTICLSGSFPLPNGPPFSDLNGLFPRMPSWAVLPSWKSFGKPPIKKRPTKRFLTKKKLSGRISCGHPGSKPWKPNIWAWTSTDVHDPKGVQKNLAQMSLKSAIQHVTCNHHPSVLRPGFHWKQRDMSTSQTIHCTGGRISCGSTSGREVRWEICEPKHLDWREAALCMHCLDGAFQPWGKKSVWNSILSQVVVDSQMP